MEHFVPAQLEKFALISAFQERNAGVRQKERRWGSEPRFSARLLIDERRGVGITNALVAQKAQGECNHPQEEE